MVRHPRSVSIAALRLMLVVVLAVPAMAGSAQARTAGLALNDPLAGTQWYLRHDGLQTVWPRTRGGRVIVAVIDSGVDMTHPDLRQNLWTNPKEIPGNGVDDDHNGFVDDVHGYDFVDDDGDPSDEDGHGTHVAGILAARGNNGIGVSGVAQRARLMVLRVLDAHDIGNTAWLAEALDYAVVNGARVVNISMNGSRDSPELDAAIERARLAGVVLVVSAGNDGQDLDLVPSFPACSQAPNVVTVGSVGRSGAMSAFSNFGSCVDVTAPGEDIVSTQRGGGYELRSGTSMATPQVAGAAVLAIAADPKVGADRLAAALSAAGRGMRTSRGATSAPPRLSAARLLRRLR